MSFIVNIAPHILGSAGTAQLLTANTINELIGTAGDTCVLTAPPVSTGTWFGLTYTQPLTGSPATISWFSNLLWAGGLAPTLTSANGKTDTFSFYYSTSRSAWLGFVSGLNS